jgi:Trk-type K+ transport system membrane component
MQSLVPLLLVISAVSFTVSYYKIYVFPKKVASCDTDCACDTPKKSKQEKFAVWTFWIGLIASIIFFTYFEFQNYQTNSIAKQTTEVEKCATNPKTINTVSDTTKTKTPCCASDKKCEE